MKQDFYQIKHDGSGKDKPFSVEHVTYKNGAGKGVAKEISTHKTRVEAVTAKKVLKDAAPPPRQLEQGPGRGKRPGEEKPEPKAEKKPVAKTPPAKRKPKPKAPKVGK